MARILCVEDDPDLLKLYSNVIRDCGHDVVAVTSVPDGMQQLQHNKLQILITDWNLGGQDATQLITTAHKMKIPVMVISGSPQAFAQGFASQADLYLEKPVGPREFFGFIRDLLVAAPLAG
jgi:DNA-binding response OmpR family regulator